MVPYLVVFAVSLGVTFVCTPMVRRLSLRLGWVDHPSDRKVHPRATPTVGGLAIFLGIVVALTLSRVIPFFSGLYLTTSEANAALLGALVIFLVGVLDDTREVSALGKLAGQVLAAGIVVLAGLQLLFFYVPGFGVLSLSSDLAVPLTVLWIVAMVNAVNLIDGLDGLAAGMVAIGAASFFAYMALGPSASGEASTAALVSAVVAGAALGFLPWNFHPARIFMGDSGAMLLGFMMGVATIAGVGRNPYPPSGGDLAAIAIPIVLPLLVLAIPILDVVLAIVRRMRRGLGIAHADKEHIHHHLMDIGHSHRQAVLLLYLWSGLISLCALAVAFIDGRVIVGAVVMVAAFVAVVLPRLIRRGRIASVASTTEGVAPEAIADEASATAAPPLQPAAGGGPGPLGVAPPTAPQMKDSA